MPFVFLILGLVFLIVAINGTHRDLWGLLSDEFTSANNFFVWGAAILLIGVVGYVKTLRPVSVAFLVLIFLVMVLRDGGGVFSKFNAALRNPSTPNAPGPLHQEYQTGTHSPGGTVPQAPTTPIQPGQPLYVPNIANF